MSHLYTELRHLPPPLTPRQAEKRPMRELDEPEGVAAHPVDSWEHVTKAAVEIAATSATAGLMWGMLWPSGQQQASSAQWLLASLVCAPVLGLATHRALRPGTSPPPAAHVVPLLLAAATLGLGGGRFVGNTLGSVAALLRF